MTQEAQIIRPALFGAKFHPDARKNYERILKGVRGSLARLCYVKIVSDPIAYLLEAEAVALSGGDVEILKSDVAELFTLVDRRSFFIKVVINAHQTQISIREFLETGPDETVTSSAGQSVELSNEKHRVTSEITGTAAYLNRIRKHAKEPIFWTKRTVRNILPNHIQKLFPEPNLVDPIAELFSSSQSTDIGNTSLSALIFKEIGGKNNELFILCDASIPLSDAGRISEFIFRFSTENNIDHNILHEKICFVVFFGKYANEYSSILFSSYSWTERRLVGPREFGNFFVKLFRWFTRPISAVKLEADPLSFKCRASYLVKQV